MKKIAIIPIDNRPICYPLIEQITAIDKNIELFMPHRSLLGGLTTNADTEGILTWLNDLKSVDYLIIALDTIAYGGLVSSRRSPLTYNDIKERLLKFKKAIKALNSKVYAFSSIMRISNNNINEEEKEYWNPWGTRIFSYSYHQHKARILKESNCVINTVPSDILEDYTATRKRNFEINRLYLDWLNEGTLDTLVYSKDDTGEFGLNVEEAQTLETEANTRKLNALIKTGADEIPLSLLTRAITDGKDVKVAPLYAYEDSKVKISKYEDISVENCVNSQISLAGAGFETLENAQMLMYVNNFQYEQGDLVLGEVINRSQAIFKTPNMPYFIADINNANGSDDEFIKLYGNKIFKNADFMGYAAYNTSANTIGCALCIALTSFLAKERGTFNESAFKKLMAIRLLDDWAYQARLRKAVRETKEDFNTALNESITEFERFQSEIESFLEYDIKSVKYTLPWNRSFEIEILIQP